MRIAPDKTTAIEKHNAILSKETLRSRTQMAANRRQVSVSQRLPRLGRFERFWVLRRRYAVQFHAWTSHRTDHRLPHYSTAVEARVLEEPIDNAKNDKTLYNIIAWHNLAPDPPVSPLETDSQAFETTSDKAEALRRHEGEEYLLGPLEVSIEEVERNTIGVTSTSPVADHIALRLLEACRHQCGDTTPIHPRHNPGLKADPRAALARAVLIAPRSSGASAEMPQSRHHGFSATAMPRWSSATYEHGKPQDMPAWKKTKPLISLPTGMPSPSPPHDDPHADCLRTAATTERCSRPGGSRSLTNFSTGIVNRRFNHEDAQLNRSFRRNKTSDHIAFCRLAKRSFRGIGRSDPPPLPSTNRREAIVYLLSLELAEYHRPQPTP
ncbi:hypothetical protein NUU61_001344 [Penicillium alfredii]|uniref:Uncharacterized protein n=1 Tax=Penicillium alfredii TaxID=1506179 RepID=A0A9W9G3Y8_9EURO|nr:uncharacterized protein NUU61_001344 [Penicillium alfredii]KAJ5111714.1 hypothetical protein NUU61_001344 [Penicillium alfredii]